ncbi:MAG: hypothetical protein JF616_20935 [Fibrobacteres bacterium]|nr:hypothetical protein [Fibrobacterota bacterium]
MPEMNGQTDQVLKVQLKSQILAASWELAEIAAGGTVPIEVTTLYVAEGSDIQITVKDLEGKTIDTVKGKVYSNLYRAPFTASKPNKTGGMYYEAELSPHGLKAVSPRLKVGPPVKISGLKFLDEKGAEMKSFDQADRIELTGKIEGPPEGTPCTFALYLDEGKPEPTFIRSAQGKIEGGKASYIWKFTPPSWEPRHLIKRDIARDGEEYSPMRYLFELGCLGVRALSAPLEYVSWVEVDFGPIQGKAKLQMPDGSEKTMDIPADGILKVASPGAGRILLLDILT